jgi:hypothetical protein
MQPSARSGAVARSVATVADADRVIGERATNPQKVGTMNASRASIDRRPDRAGSRVFDQFFRTRPGPPGRASASGTDPARLRGTTEVSFDSIRNDHLQSNIAPTMAYYQLFLEMAKGAR